MKTILVPTDFSDAAGNAAEYAAHLAKDMDAKIILFHAYHFPTPVSEVPVMIITPDELQQENEALLKEYSARLKKKTGVDAEYIAKIGLAADEILQEGVAADLIVMGMRGAGKLSEALIGSIATAVLRKSQTPVLVIPAKASYKRLERVVFACDYDPRTNVHRLNFLKELLKAFKAKLYILNVKEKKETVSVEQAVTGVKLENELYDVEHVYYFPESDDLVTGINEFIESHRADMVVTIPHVYNLIDRLFHRSISKKMAFHVQVPLLALPDSHKSASAYFL